MSDCGYFSVDVMFVQQAMHIRQVCPPVRRAARERPTWWLCVNGRLQCSTIRIQRNMLQLWPYMCAVPHDTTHRLDVV